MEEANLHTSLTSIGKEAFEGYTSLKEANLKDTMITIIEDPTVKGLRQVRANGLPVTATMVEDVVAVHDVSFTSVSNSTTAVTSEVTLSPPPPKKWIPCPTPF